MLQQGEGITPPDVYPAKRGQPFASFDEEFAGKFPDTLLVPRGRFHLDAVARLGRWSYGDLNVLSFGGGGEHLEIGDCCSIGPDALFVLGGEHPLERLSTFPFGVMALGEAYDPRLNISKGPIIVNDDVWIGAKATVLSGVTLGQGCVVGAGSVVARDVEPYEVVAGAPVVHVRYRFSEPIRRKLEALDYSKLTMKKIQKLRPLLQAELTEASLEAILKELSG